MADHVGDDAGGHGVLQPDQESVRLEVGLDQLGMPARVVGLGHQEHDIEHLVHRGELAQVIGPHLGADLALPELHVQAVQAHRLDVGGPLVDQHDVEARVGEVGGDATAVRAGAEDCDFLIHDAFGKLHSGFRLYCLISFAMLSTSSRRNLANSCGVSVIAT